MNEIREILTKAVIGKGNRNFELTVMMPETTGLVQRVLGAVMTYHQMNAARAGDLIEISGSYEVHVWYTYDDGKQTDIVRTTVDYKDRIELRNALRAHLLDSDEIMVEESVAPYATDVRIESGIIHVDVAFEVMAEVIGETKMRVAILGPVVETFNPEISFDPDDDLAEIDAAITPDFLEATIAPFD
ncbi:MAG: outer spore coat protein CotE [Defluviitaleaceae bacterium]|nr:outer spore coat protein CotE [Defluviitaleaceae bacterium]